MSKVSDNSKNQISKFKDIITILDQSKKNRIIFLSFLILIGLSIRLFYFPFDVPLLNDAQGYFWYAIEINILNNLPYTDIIQYPNGQTGHTITNNGWPIFLSLAFRLIDSDNFLDYHNLQRMLSVIFSISAIIPVYLLCNRFFKKSYSLLASSLFILEPRLIQNSILGTSESFYIFLFASSLFLFLSNNLRVIYSGFAVLALFSIVRYEGMLMIIPFSVIFFVRYRKQKKILIRYVICILILIMILIPVAYLKNETMGHDGFVSHVSAGPQYYQTTINDNTSTINSLFYSGSINLIKYLGWVQIPIFIIFIPIGIFYLFTKMDYKKSMIVLTILTMLVPAFYAYSREFFDTKYLYVLYPIFCIIAGYTINFFFEKNVKRNLIFGLILIGIVFGSVTFLEWKTIDQEHYRETFLILQEIYEKPIKINGDFGTHGGEFTFFHWVLVENAKEFPILKKELPISNIEYAKQISLLRLDSMKDIDNFDESRNYYTKTKNLKDYLEILEEQKVSHLLLDKNNNVRLTSDELRIILQDIFKNESDYPYLVKEYDSKDKGFNYHIKLFKIDYELYKEFQK